MSSFLLFFSHLSLSLPCLLLNILPHLLPTSIFVSTNTQASSVPVISPLRGTMGCLTRFRPCAGSTRTSATSAETQRGSPSSAPELGLPASTSSSSHTTRRVIEDSVVGFLHLSPYFFMCFFQKRWSTKFTPVMGFLQYDDFFPRLLIAWIQPCESLMNHKFVD